MHVRRTGSVTVAALSSLALTLGLVHAVAPEWAQRVGLDVWNYPGDFADARAEEERGRTLASDAAHRRSEHAMYIATRLAHGSMTLAEAVTELEPGLRDCPGFETTRTVRYKAPTFRHGVARYAIMKVQLVLAADAARWSALSARLETEYVALR